MYIQSCAVCLHCQDEEKNPHGFGMLPERHSPPFEMFFFIVFRVFCFFCDNCFCCRFYSALPFNSSCKSWGFNVRGLGWAMGGLQGGFAGIPPELQVGF